MPDARELDRDRRRAIDEARRQRVEHLKTLDLLERWLTRSTIPKGRSAPNRCFLCDEPDMHVNFVEWRRACPHHETAQYITQMRAKLTATMIDLPMRFTEPDPATLTD